MWRRVLIACALLLAVPLATVLWLVYTESGLRFVVAQLDRLQTMQIKVEGLSGTIAGPLRLQRFELDHERVHIIVHDVVADFRIRGLLLLTINARSVSGRDALVEVRRVDKPDSGKPPHFLPAFLHIRARDVALDRVRYVNLNGLVIDADRIAAERVRLSRSRLHVDDFTVQSQLFTGSGNYEMQAQRPLRLGGNANGTLRSPRGVPLEMQAKLSGDLDALAMEVQLRSPDIANVRAVLTRPNKSWRIAGRVASPSLGLESVLQKPPFRLEDVAVRFDLNPQRMHAEGALSIPRIGPLFADATGTFAAKRLTLQRAVIRARDGDAQVVASGTVQFGGDSPAIDAQARWSQVQYPLRGAAIVRSAKGELRMQGAMPYTFTVAGELGGDDVPAATLDAQGVLSKTDVRLDSYAVQTLKGSLSGSGSLRFDEPQAWHLQAQALDLDPATLHAQFPGRLSFTAEANGRGLDRAAYFDARIGELSGELRGEPVRGRGRIERVEHGVRLEGVDARWSSTHLAANGLVGEQLDVQWSLQSRSLNKFLPELGGQVTSSGKASGALKTPRVTATLTATHLRYREWRVGALDVDGDVDTGSERQSRLAVHARNVGREQTWFGDVRIAADGNRGAHDITVDLQGTEPQAQAHVEVQGRYAESVWSAVLSEIVASDGARKLQLQQPARIELAQSRASVEPLCIAIGEGKICAQGAWERAGPWSAQAQIDALPLAALLEQRRDDQRLTGTVSGRARAGTDGTLPWSGEADLHVDDATLHYRVTKGTEETVQLGSGALAVATDLNAITLDVDLRALENTFVRATTQLTRTAAPFKELPLRGDIKARTADANLLPLLVPDIDRADGVLEADISLGGVLAAPRIDGRISLKDGELDFYRVNLALRELQVTADLQDTGLEFEATARAGDGHLRANGDFEWSNRELQGVLRLSGQELLVADLPEYRVVASPDMKFQLAGDEIDVTGQVLIPSARIQPVDLSGAVRVSEDARFVNDSVDQKASRFVVSSTVRTVIGNDVRLDTFGLQGRLQGEVTSVVHTGEKPMGRGELSVKEGKYEAYGQKLEITRGRLLMDNTPLDDPALDIQAERKLEEIKLGVNVRGTLRAPRLSFFSEPSMPQTQIVEYLLVGKPLDEYQNLDAQRTGSAGNTLALQGGGLLASQLGRKIGLEEVGVQSDSVNGAALVLGKFLSPRLFVSYGISLTEAINTLKMRYTISDHWLLRTESGEAQAADLEFTIER